MAKKKSDPEVCQRILGMLREQGEVVLSGWPELHRYLGYGANLSMTKLKNSVGSLHFKQGLIVRPVQGDEIVLRCTAKGLR